MTETNGKQQARWDGHVSFLIRTGWRQIKVTVEANTAQVAARRAVVEARRQLPPRKKVEGVQLLLARS